MAIMITDDCINCGACEPECPNNAIYEGGAGWQLADGTGFKGDGEHPTAVMVNAIPPAAGPLSNWTVDGLGRGTCKNGRQIFEQVSIAKGLEAKP